MTLATTLDLATLEATLRAVLDALQAHSGLTDEDAALVAAWRGRQACRAANYGDSLWWVQASSDLHAAATLLALYD